MRLFKIIGGVLLIVVGFAALVTPFTPGSWLIFVGLELLGIRLAMWDTIKKRYLGWRVHDSDTKTRDNTDITQ